MKTPKFWYKKKTLLSLALLPLSGLWLLVSYLKNKLKKKHYFNIPIICIGNAIAGGGGKTPLILELCKQYRSKKISVHVVYKAYKVSIINKAMKINQTHTNGHGYCHGGVIFTLADATFGFACNSYNVKAVAQNCTITYICPVMESEVLVSEAKEIKKISQQLASVIEEEVRLSIVDDSKKTTISNSQIVNSKNKPSSLIGLTV